MSYTAGATRNLPASEGELLEQERAVGHLSTKLRWRVLGMFSAYKSGAEISMPELIAHQQFEGVSFVGAVSTLLGQEGLYSQCLWYKPSEFEWYWARLERVEKIECRNDPRFRGGVTCLWLTTSIAEYAMTVPHPQYHHEWEAVLATYDVAPIEAWPKSGFRPDWWPVQSSGHWPHQQREEEGDQLISPDEEVRQLMELLSAQDVSSRTSWLRLGPHGDQRFPGQPAHHLGQFLQWDLPYNGGLKVTRNQLANTAETEREETAETTIKGQGKKRKGASQGGRHARFKR